MILQVEKQFFSKKLAIFKNMRYNIIKIAKNEKKERKKMEINEKAYAKINLFLDVTAKRKDGFHEICSVMHTVSLADTVSVKVDKAEYSCITLHMKNTDIPADERNLAYLAAEAFLDKTGKSAALDITVEKYIPSAAGLGGGSSDAAAVLRALNMAFGNPLSVHELCALGATLGSDIPFCIVGGTRLCRGKGEQMSAYPIDDAYFVIVPPVAAKMETPRAYRMLDEAFDNYENENEALHDALFSFFVEDPVLGMYNVFESVVLPASPETDEVRQELCRLGAKGAMMSGSGTAVFGVFETEEEANAAARELPGAVVCTGIPALL